MSDADPTPQEPTAVTSGETAGKRGYPFHTVLGLAILAVLGLLATAGVKSYRDLDAAKSYERQLLDEIAGAKERVRGLERRIDSIQNDPAMLERLAREDLGMVRESDLVIVLPDHPSDGDSPSGDSPQGSRLATGSPPPPAVDRSSP